MRYQEDDGTYLSHGKTFAQQLNLLPNELVRDTSTSPLREKAWQLFTPRSRKAA
jgi:hypothetical protein